LSIQLLFPLRQLFNEASVWTDVVAAFLAMFVGLLKKIQKYSFQSHALKSGTFLRKESVFQDPAIQEHFN
jgi:hypothetical protein